MAPSYECPGDTKIGVTGTLSQGGPFRDPSARFNAATCPRTPWIYRHRLTIATLVVSSTLARMTCPTSLPGRAPRRLQEPFSPQTAAKTSRLRGRHGHRGRLPLLRRRLRPAHLHQGRQAHRHRGQPARARSTRARSAPRAPNAFQLAVNPHRVTQVLYRAPYSDHWETKPLDWALDQIAQRVKAARDADFTARDERGRAAQLGPLDRHPRRGDDRQRRELPDQEAVRRRAGRGLDREPGPDMTLAPRCPVWAPRSAAVRPPTISRTSPTATASCSWARTWPRPTRSASAGR